MLQALPYNAMIMSEHHELSEGSYFLCNHCYQPFTSSQVFVVGVPPTVIDGRATRHYHMVVCSKECALDWLQALKPEPQEKVLLSSSLLLPTMVKEGIWLYTYSKDRNYPIDHPLRSGNWLVFSKQATVDHYWQRIANAVIDGYLGSYIKVSSFSEKKDRGVICVHTYDYEDKTDVMRIRQMLKNCGILQPIRYKRDIDTLLSRRKSDYKPVYEA